MVLFVGRVSLKPCNLFHLLQGYMLDELTSFLAQRNRTALAWDDSFVNLAGESHLAGISWTPNVMQ